MSLHVAVLVASGVVVGVMAGLQFWPFVIPTLVSMLATSLVLLLNGESGEVILKFFVIFFLGVLIGDWFWRMEYRFRTWMKGTTKPVVAKPLKPREEQEDKEAKQD